MMSGMESSPVPVQPRAPAPPGPVPPDLRLDLWLVGERGVSRSTAQRLIAAGLVRVNGEPARPGHRVRGTDSVEVSAEPERADVPPRPGPAVDLHIVHEDEWLAVIDKPAGLVVHPAPGHPDGTLADGLRQRGAIWSVIGGDERPGIVHRLDRFTSGLLVAAKTEAAHRALAAQLESRRLGRTYWVLVHGRITEDTGEIDAPIGRDPRHRQRMAVVDDGRPALTEFRVMERCVDTSVLDVSLRTGRTHQIRVHCRYIGRPVVGDPVYGRDSAQMRPALHARALRFVHPADGGERAFESTLPPDLQALLERARAEPVGGMPR
jgi:23S rRNA pseudouridine1911/1915/1917 synthase